MSMTPEESTCVVRYPEPAPGRDVDTVPFVELFNNRVQGVVCSGSDPARVYCVYLEAGSGNHYSSTNNNRPDAGTAKRPGWLLDEAVKQFGPERVARYLQAPCDPTGVKKGSEILNHLMRRGARRQEPAGVVFSRFLNYLRLVELTAAQGPAPEMAWFVSQ